MQRTFRRITVTVITDGPLPVGEQVFIAGNQTELGCWRPDGLPLTRVSDNRWSGAVDLPAVEPVEFKITRGTWRTEEVWSHPVDLPNRGLPPGDDAALEFFVRRWKDGAESSTSAAP